jgi:hypothetical protein
MNIIIEKGSKVKCVQVQFNGHYPFLKLMFFKDRSTGRALLISACGSEESLEKLPGFIGPATISIDGQRTVAQLEKDFKEQVGLFAQVFRRTGNLWIETTLTNTWTLERQNKEGEQISTHF